MGDEFDVELELSMFDVTNDHAGPTTYHLALTRHSGTSFGKSLPSESDSGHSLTVGTERCPTDQ